MLILIGDKNFRGEDFEAELAALEAVIMRPRRKDEPGRGPHLAPIRQRIESIFQTCKHIFTLERHGARTLEPPRATRQPLRRTCGVCGQRCPGFDVGEVRRRWRALDLGATLAFVEAEAPRVRCAEHGVVVCAVPWARHQSRFTRSFEDQVAWLAVATQ